jgi:hypothetical protein
MKKIIILLFSLCNFLFSSGTYDSFNFTDEEEKYSVFFCNTATSAEITAIGLSTSDYTAIAGLRPLPSDTPSNISSSLSSVANNSNITGNDMKRIREWSYRVVIPDHNATMTAYTALGVKQSDQNYLMALCGLLIGFLFAYGLIVNINQIGKGGY